jgi:hypothetical protein
MLLAAYPLFQNMFDNQCGGSTQGPIPPPPLPTHHLTQQLEEAETKPHDYMLTYKIANLNLLDHLCRLAFFVTSKLDSLLSHFIISEHPILQPPAVKP